jgi:hypothetical protein
VVGAASCHCLAWGHRQDHFSGLSEAPLRCPRRPSKLPCSLHDTTRGGCAHSGPGSILVSCRKQRRPVWLFVSTKGEVGAALSFEFSRCRSLTITTEKRDVAPSFRAGDQGASAEAAFHTEGLEPVDATRIS